MGLTVTFIGHREIQMTEELTEQIRTLLAYLVINCGARTFLFGSRSEFDTVCRDGISALKSFYPDIRRVYVRAEYPYINQDYTDMLLEFYDETYFPDSMLRAGRAAYVERNRHMIDRSDICVFYCDTSTKEKSGAKIAYTYAEKKKKQIINLFTPI